MVPVGLIIKVSKKVLAKVQEEYTKDDTTPVKTTTTTTTTKQTAKVEQQKRRSSSSSDRSQRKSDSKDEHEHETLDALIGLGVHLVKGATAAVSKQNTGLAKRDGDY